MVCLAFVSDGGQGKFPGPNCWNVLGASDDSDVNRILPERRGNQDSPKPGCVREEW